MAALSNALEAVPATHSMPIRKNVLIQTCGADYIKIAGYGSDFYIAVWIKATVQEDGAITLPAKLLNELVSSMTQFDEMSMSVNVRTQTATIEMSGGGQIRNSTANIKGIDAADYPLLILHDEYDPNAQDLPEGTKEISIMPTRFGEMLTQTATCAGTDDSRPTLEGMLISIKDSKMTTVCVDGYRLCRRVEETRSTSDVSSTLIMASDMLKVGKIFKSYHDKEEWLRVFFMKRGDILFDMKPPNGSLVTAVQICVTPIDAKFPDYEVVIPRNHNIRVTLKRAALLKAVQTAMIFAKDNANIVSIEVEHPDNKKIALFANTTESGDSKIEVEASVTWDAEPAGRFAVNGAYLKAALSTMPDEESGEMVINMTVPTRPLVLRPLDRSLEQYTYVIMPMHPPK